MNISRFLFPILLLILTSCTTKKSTIFLNDKSMENQLFTTPKKLHFNRQLSTMDIIKGNSIYIFSSISQKMTNSTIEENNILISTGQFQKPLHQVPNISKNTTLPNHNLDKEKLSFKTSKKTKKYFSYAEYYTAIEAFNEEKSYDALYYRGMSYYQLMINSSYSKEERNNFYKKAISDLYIVYEGYTSHNEKRALSIFWYSVANYLNLINFPIVNSLKKITEDTQLSKTKRYNDALYLIALIYDKDSIQKTKDIIETIRNIENDRIIWDISKKMYISNQEAIDNLESLIL